MGVASPCIEVECALAEWEISSMWRSLPVAVEVIGHRLRDRHTSRMGRANEFHSNLALLH